MKPTALLVSILAILLALAACNNARDTTNVNGVTITSNLSGAADGVAAQGVPRDPSTGLTGVDHAVLEVFDSNNTQVLFDAEGRVTESTEEAEPVVLTPANDSVLLFLSPGTYTFELTAHDEFTNTIAFGEITTAVETHSTVQLPLVSLLGSVELVAPESVSPNEVFDVFLLAHPPERPDLRVPEFDYEVLYTVSETSFKIDESNLGVRVAADCAAVVIEATVQSLSAESPTPLTATKEIPLGDACVVASADLVPPYVRIVSPEDNATAGDGSIKLEGLVNDLQTGMDRVEIYDGPVLLGEAELNTEEVPNTWSFEFVPSELRTYELIALAVDNATNTNRASVSVQVTESPVEELRAAIQAVIPGLREFELVHIDDTEIVASLKEKAALQEGEPSMEPVASLLLPAVQSAREIVDLDFTLYYVNIREQGVALYDLDPKGAQLANESILPYSYTFQGLPGYDGAIQEVLDSNEPEQLLSDEERYQASTVGLIGDELAYSYFGPKLENVSVGQGLRSLLQPYYDPKTIESMIGAAGVNYILYDPANDETIVEDLHEERSPPVLVESQTHDHHDHDHHAEEDSITTQDHFLESGLKRLRPTVIADATIYDPDTGTWLVSDWFNRVDTAIARQNAFWYWTQIAADIPSSASSLSTNNNRIAVATRVFRYFRLTQNGKDQLDPGSYPTEGCDSGGLIDSFRNISFDSTAIENEYWMWWTNDRGGGCAFVGALHLTPRDGNVGWVGMRNRTVDRSALTFVHESGHIVDASHSVDAFGDTGWTASSSSGHRCYLLGFIALNPQTASIMSYDSPSNRTYCFAYTDSDGSPKKNTTRVAEYLHGALD